MILYTAVSPETVLEGIDTYQPEYIEIKLNGLDVQVEMLNGTQARIVRLLSPNPNDYLNPSYSPGTVIEFQPTAE